MSVYLLRIVLLLHTLWALNSVSFAQVEGAAGGSEGIEIVKDFFADLGEAVCTPAGALHARIDAPSDEVILRGINLHPPVEGDTILVYKKVNVPAPSQGSKVFLAFRYGMSDGIRWDDALNLPNGARFSVYIDGQKVFDEESAEPGWRPRAVDMTPWAGGEAAVAFHTNAIDGNTSYDWALFAEPMLVAVADENRLTELPAEANGALFAQILAGTQAQVEWAVGDQRETASLTPGTHWVMLHFDQPGPVSFQTVSGEARVIKTIAAPYRYRVQLRAVDLASPLVTAGRETTALAVLKNSGLGWYPGGHDIQFALDRSFAETKAAETVQAIPAGVTSTICFAFTPQEALDACNIWARFGAEMQTAQFSIFSEEQIDAGARPPNDKGQVQIESGRATVVTPWARITVVSENRRGVYASAEAWNGSGWQRAGSLHPLARLVVRRNGMRQELPFLATAFSQEGSALVVAGQARSDDGKSWPIEIQFRPAPSAPRIDLRSTLDAPCDTELLAFYGPTLLAGDRAFGSHKDFAVFPGIEYLTQDEPSSSTRDLAPPNHDRRVPAPYRITCPLMAVQGDSVLIALLWDMHQQWAPGQSKPAARFLAPDLRLGYGFIHMSLFAPGVGEYVDENNYEAHTPFPLQQGQQIQLTGQLVLDSKARYGPDSIVHGPHRSGLLLEAMRHWFDAYGMSEPSEPPRDWDAQRALCRTAYLDTLWQESPPAWRAYPHAEARLEIGVIPLLYADMALGMHRATQGELERRIGSVLGRALREHDPAFFASRDGGSPMWGTLPYVYGYVPEAYKRLAVEGRAWISRRENGRMVWYPPDRKHRILGVPGAHTLGQPSFPVYYALRNARITGDPDLAKEALDAIKQFDLYEIPRGAAMWECPQFQPGMLAAGQAVNALCEAYMLTGEGQYMDRARFWAMTGLPFVYFWQMDGYPTMLYNVVSDFGSTHFTHSWLGMPVVWCGLDYALALQKLAEFDTSFPWRTIAKGITHSAMWQQYTDGPSKGCYPDSWDMVKNQPNPVDIQPSLIMANSFALAGRSPELQFVRLARDSAPPVMINSAADSLEVSGKADETVVMKLSGGYGPATHTTLAPVEEPAEVHGVSCRASSSEELLGAETGWLYERDLRLLAIKTRPFEEETVVSVRWNRGGGR
jgi:hypothetical protein